MMSSLNQKGVSNWLTNLPIKEHGYELTKQKFRDAIKVRYNWPLDRIPSQCVCGTSFDVTHAVCSSIGSKQKKPLISIEKCFRVNEGG